MTLCRAGGKGGLKGEIYTQVSSMCPHSFNEYWILFALLVNVQIVAVQSNFLIVFPTLLLFKLVRQLWSPRTLSNAL